MEETTYFKDKQDERIVDVLLQVTAELDRVMQRQRALEMLLAESTGLSPEQIDNFQPTESQKKELDKVRDDFMHRWLRVMTESGSHAAPLREEWSVALQQSAE